MKMSLSISLVILAISGVAVAIYAEQAPSNVPAPGPYNDSTMIQPRYGGVLTAILDSGISGLGAPQDKVQNIDYVRTAPPAMECLFFQDNQSNLRPKLAHAWDIASDGRTITFHLQKGVKFHDGTDFNAQAVKWNLENFRFGGPGGAIPSFLKTVTSYKVIDDYAIQLNLSVFNADLFNNMDLYPAMASPKAASSVTSPETVAKDHTVGTGPFIFDSWKRDQFIKYVKNPHYWQKGKPYLDGVQILQIADPVTRLMAFKSGQGQMIFRLTPSDAHDLETAGYKIILGNRPPTFYLIPDGANPESPFHNIKVREAVEYAIDKKAIVSGIGYGYYKVVDDFAPPGQTFSGLQPRNYDPRKAKQLLSEAGFPTGFKTKLMAPTTADRTALTAVQTYLKAVGIDATVDLADISRIVTITQQGWTNGILFPMSPTNGDLVSVSRFYGDKRYISAYVSAFRPSGWFEKLASAISDPNETSRAAKAHELLRMMSEQAMGIPLWTLPSIAAQDKTVHNLGWSQGMDLYAQWAEAWLSTSTM